jgi:putative ABC transport system substrate-binding protein
MDRRRMLAGLAASLMATPATGQGRLHKRVAFLRATTPQDEDFRAFRQGLAELGWSDTDVVIDVAYAAGEPSRLPALAAELAARRPDVFVIDGDLTARAVVQATEGIPVVFTLVTDPVGLGFSQSVSTPTGRLTGQTGLSLDLVAKRVELMAEALPNVRRISILVQPGPSTDAQFDRVDATAGNLGLSATLQRVIGADGLATVLDEVERERPDAVMTLFSPLFYSRRLQIVQTMRRLAIPSVHPERVFVAEGGLMSYGAVYSALWRRSAVFADRILRGARPSELPIEQPTRVELAINMRTARALGVVIPPLLIARADELID